MKLIVGLGNPGKDYEHTKHNIGFDCLNKIADYYNLSFKLDNTLNGYITKYKDNILLKPTTYMNLSGISVYKTLSYYNIDINNILIFHDDLDLDIGRIRLREKGSSGGHNGIKDIIKYLNTEEFKRVKIGISKDKNIPVDKYVLSKFSKGQRIIIEDIINLSVDIFNDFTNDLYFIDIMTKYNSIDKSINSISKF